MSTIELRNRLIDKIQKTDNENLLQEVYRLLELETEDIEVYKLSDDLRKLLMKRDNKSKTGNFLQTIRQTKT